MKKTSFLLTGLVLSFCFGFFLKPVATLPAKAPAETAQSTDNPPTTKPMKLGAFSISLSVKDLKTSREFYENLGFSVFAGSMENHYLIMKNENALIGLFQGMFEGNILTFNPGWDENARNLEKFDDIREIQKQLKSKNIKLTSEANEQTSGPASLMMTDPDGNVILLDQHR